MIFCIIQQLLHICSHNQGRYQNVHTAPPSDVFDCPDNTQNDYKSMTARGLAPNLPLIFRSSQLQDSGFIDFRLGIFYIAGFLFIFLVKASFALGVIRLDVKPFTALFWRYTHTQIRLRFECILCVSGSFALLLRHFLNSSDFASKTATPRSCFTK